MLFELLMDFHERTLSSDLKRFFIEISWPLHWGAWTLSTHDEPRRIRRLAQWTILGLHIYVYLHNLPGAVEHSDTAFYIYTATVECVSTAYCLGRIGAVQGNRDICNVEVGRRAFDVLLLALILLHFVILAIMVASTSSLFYLFIFITLSFFMLAAAYITAVPPKTPTSVL